MADSEQDQRLQAACVAYSDGAWPEQSHGDERERHEFWMRKALAAADAVTPPAPPQAGLTDDVRKFLISLAGWSLIDPPLDGGLIAARAAELLSAGPVTQAAPASQAGLRMDDNERWRIIYYDATTKTATTYAHGRELTDLLRQADPSGYLRGHAGRSAAPPELRTYIDQAIAVLRELQNSAIVPHDFHAGAIAALELIRRQFDKED